MRALIFAAGKGERMRPLTEHTPKPLLRARGKPLVEWHLEKLAAAGVTDVVLNISWLAHAFAPALGDGSHWGLRLHWSAEGDEPLETGGGMLQALPLLGDEPFIAINGDIFTDYDFARLMRAPLGLAHLVLVDNPDHNPGGDFALGPDLHVAADGPANVSFAGIGIYRPELLVGWREIIGPTPGASHDPPRFRVVPLLQAAMARGEISGEHHRGEWTDVGTPERLAGLG